MEIIIENDGLEAEEFHAVASGETGDTLRQTAKNYLASQNVSERQLEELKMQGGIEYELLRRKMSRHALEVVNLPPDLTIWMDITFSGGKKA